MIEEVPPLVRSAITRAVRAMVGVPSPRGEYELFTLTMNGQSRTCGTVQEASAAVAERVTTLLAAAPDRLAAEALELNRAFTDGSVKASLDERGEWFTVFDAYGEHPLRIRIVKE